MTTTVTLAATETEPTDAELDEACERMRPAAQRLVGAVRARDAACVRACFADAQAVDVPLGRFRYEVLALVLADEVDRREQAAATKATWNERARCMYLAVSLVRLPVHRQLDALRRLPERISRGETA